MIRRGTAAALYADDVRTLSIGGIDKERSAGTTSPHKIAAVVGSGGIDLIPGFMCYPSGRKHHPGTVFRLANRKCPLRIVKPVCQPAPANAVADSNTQTNDPNVVLRFRIGD